MASPGTIAAAGPRAPAGRTVLRVEIIETIKLGWPMALTQLGQIAMMTTDLALIGRLGSDAIAAVGLAHLILFIGFVLGMGPVSAVAPLAAQAFGARNPRMVRRSLVGFSSAYALAFPFHLGAIGIWIGFSLGVTTFAALLVCRFHLLTLHNYLPAPPDSDATPV